MGGSSSHPEFFRANIQHQGYVNLISDSASKRVWLNLTPQKFYYSQILGGAVIFIQPRSLVKPITNLSIRKTEYYTKTLYIEVTTTKNLNEIWKVQAQNLIQYNSWKVALEKASRPVWDEQSTSECQDCGKKFKLFVRQHHCRNCGKAVCRTHSKFRAPILKLGYKKKVRICGTCYSLLNE